MMGKCDRIEWWDSEGVSRKVTTTTTSYKDREDLCPSSREDGDNLIQAVSRLLDLLVLAVCLYHPSLEPHRLLTVS